MIITAIPITPENNKNTYWFISFCKNGNANVIMRARNQFSEMQIAIAELRAFCLKHSAVYKNGMGPFLIVENN